MAPTYAFLPEETVVEAASRVGREQLDKAIAELTTRSAHDPDKAIHNARKAIKRERSLLRLLGGALSRRERRRENAALRDAARRLSGARDAAALVTATDALSNRFAGQLPERAFTTIREALAGDQDSHTATIDVAARVTATASELDAVRGRSAGWELRRDGWSALDAGLVRAYARGRKALTKARRSRSDDALHGLRKRVKDLWYQSQLLAEVGGPMLAGQAEDAHRLANLLGDDHDLAVLDETLARSVSVPVDVDGVRDLIAHRRDELQAEAFRLGRRVYAEPPKAFRRRMRRYWRTSHAPATTPALAPASA